MPSRSVLIASLLSTSLATQATTRVNLLT